MEMLGCALCGGRNLKKLFSTVDSNETSDELFTVVECISCRLAFLNPMPSKDELVKYYPSEYYGEKGVKFNPIIEFFVKLSRLHRAKKILKYKNSGRALDIGCGRGYMLSILKERGWDVLGTELSEKSSLFAREALGINVITKDIEEVFLEDETFDVVTMWHTFEHLAYPMMTLKKIFKILKKDGVLIITVPNFGSFQSLISKEKWFHLDCPRHLFLYTPETIKAILNKNGFSVLKMKYASLEYNYFGMIQSLYNILGVKTNYLYDLIRQKEAKLSPSPLSSPQRGEGLKNLFLTLVFMPVLLPVAIFTSFLLDFTRLGGNIEVHAKKNH